MIVGRNFPKIKKENRINKKENYAFCCFTIEQGVTKRCRLSLLTKSAPVYEPKCGEEGSCGGLSR
jgi:hypothetical protein